MNDLPPGWSSVRLEDLAEVNPRNPAVVPSKDALISFVPMACVEAMTGRMDASEERPWGDVTKGYTRFQEGDVLFAKITPCMENGKVALAKNLTSRVGAGSTEFHVLRPRDGVSSGYLLQFLLQSSVRKNAQRQMKGTAGQLRVPVDFLLDLQLPCPPVGEQQRIVEGIDSYFSRLDDAQASLERVQRNLKRYRASVLSAAVNGRLVPTEAEMAREEGRDYEHASVLLKRILKERRRRWEEAELAWLLAKGKSPKDDRWKAKYKEPVEPDVDELPKLPEGWCWTTVDAIGDVLLGRQRAPQFLKGTHSRPYLRVANIKDDALDLSDIKWMDFDGDHYEKYHLLPGDILVSEGQSPELVGQSAIYRGGIDELCFQKTLHRFRVHPATPYGSSSDKNLTRLVQGEDLQLEELRIPVAVGPPFQDFDLVVRPFQWTGSDRVVVPRQDPLSM